MHHWALGLLLLVGVAATLLWRQPAQSPPALPASTLQGVWQVVGDPMGMGDGPLSQAAFAVVPTRANQVRLVWVRDGWCAQVDARIFGRELHVLHEQPRIIVTFDTDVTAMATVYQGEQQWTQHYVKQRVTVPACDWLLR